MFVSPYIEPLATFHPKSIARFVATKNENNCHSKIIIIIKNKNNSHVLRVKVLNIHFMQHILQKMCVVAW